jgi:DNA-binding PadR family transcriptional regulator
MDHYEWSASEEGKRVKSYQLTTAGCQLSDEKRQWDRIVAAIAQVLDTSN